MRLHNGMIAKNGSLSTYLNGMPSRLTLEEDWQSPDMFFVKKNTEVVFDDVGNVLQFVLKNNFTDTVTKMVYLAGKPIKMSSEYYFTEFYLAENWKTPQGNIIKSHCLVKMSKNDQQNLHPICYTLAKNWKDPIQRVWKANTQVVFSLDGTLLKITLAKNWEYGSGLVFKANNQVEWYQNGKLCKVTLAGKWTDPNNGMIFKANSEICWYDNGILKEFTLEKDWENIDHMIYKAKKRVLQHSNRIPKEFTISKDWISKEGVKINANRIVKFSEDGSLLS